MGDKDGKGGGGGARGNTVLVVGIVLWLVSWFAPVWKGQELFGGLGALAEKMGARPDQAAAAATGPDWLPGWPACRFAWELLWNDPQPGKLEEWEQRLCGASCLTNVVMLLAIALVLSRRPSVLAGVLVLACAGVNSSWTWVVDQNPFEWLRAGYFLWLLSFVLVGVGLCRGRRA